MYGMKEQFQEWLDLFLADIGAIAGTVHICEDRGLRLKAAVNIPEIVLQTVNWLPSGKGMAGLALERGEPIKTCNLKDDSSGNVRPGAKAVNAKAAVAIPIRDHQGVIVSVVGAAFTDEEEISDSKIRELTNRAEGLLLHLRYTNHDN